MNTYLKRALGLSLAGVLFAGYLSGVKLFSATCAFNESCPIFLGYPACYFGFAMFLALFVMSCLGLARTVDARAAARANAIVSGLGILFAGTFVLDEIGLWMTGAAPRYELLLPTCAYGLIFYVAVFALSAVAARRPTGGTRTANGAPGA